MNHVILIGRLTRDPELRYTKDGKPCCNMTLAVNRHDRKSADFLRVVVWDKQAEACEKYLARGSQCAVAGRIQTGSYEDKDGKKIYTTDIQASQVEFLSQKGSSTTTNDSIPEESFPTIADDEIPF